MTISRIRIDTAAKRAALVLAAVIFVPAAWMVVQWCIAASAVQRVEDVELALYLARLGPDDPQTHRAAAVELEKSFDPVDIQRALIEFEIAAGLSPNNYMAWLDLGRARDRSGDAQGAEAALRRALALAPNYSRVHWALGNNLLRQFRIDEGFAAIRRAVAADTTYAAPAAAAAWQFFDGDLSEIRRLMDGSSGFDAALVTMLAAEQRFDEALEIWSKLPVEEKHGALKETGRTLLAKLLESKRFRSALQVSSELSEHSAKIGSVANGSFESAVKPEGAAEFEWQIAAGLQPQIVLSTSQRREGSQSLLLVFNSTDIKDFRTVSQTVALEPGKDYELELFSRSDLKTPAALRWEVVDAATGKQLSTTEAISPKADWTRLAARFRTPAQTDGIVIRLVREGCTQICPVAGNLWFDDFSLRPAA